MTLGECITAYNAVTEILNMEFSYCVSYAMVKAKHELEGAIAFYSEEEQKLIEKFGHKNDAGKVDIVDNRFQIEKGKESDFATAKLELMSVTSGIERRTLKFAPEKIKPSVLEGLMLIFDIEVDE